LIIVILEMVSYQNMKEVTEERPLGEPRRLGIWRKSISALAFFQRPTPSQHSTAKSSLNPDL